MRIIFMGASAFAVPTLRGIVQAGHAVVAAYTRPPKPGGRRGLQVRNTPIHEAAEALGIPVFTPTTLRDDGIHSLIRDHEADIGLVIAYGLLLPRAVLRAPKFGWLNLHASILPRWRGAAPIQRAIMTGDIVTGVDLMRMEEGLDTGPVAMRELVRIRPEDTTGDLADRLAETAADLAELGLIKLESETLEFSEQSTHGVTYAHKIEKGEAEIDWSQPAEQVRNHVHGLSPSPGAFSTLTLQLEIQRIRVLRAEVVVTSGHPGTILDKQMTVACGNDSIRLIEVQRPGGNVVHGHEMMRQQSLSPGTTFKLIKRPSSK
jgi:methionyl-tRNA formyltransferase